MRILSVFLLVSAAFAQIPYNFGNPPLGGPKTITTKYMENSSTDFKTKDTWVDLLVLSNKSGSAVTVRISDKSTQCNSGACDVIPTVSIAANTAYIVPAAGGLYFRSGINWVASAANAVVVQIRALTVN
jgi:hypothetical protein